MGVLVPYRIYTEIPKEGSFRADQKGTCRGILSSGETERVFDRRSARNVYSCPYDVSIPPKYALSQVAGFLKGKSAIHIAHTYLGRKRNYVGQNILDQ